MAAERLRRELMELDGSHGHRYFKTFERQLRGGGSALETTDLYLAASLADLIYVGDFHALPASQRLAADPVLVVRELLVALTQPTPLVLLLLATHLALQLTHQPQRRGQVIARPGLTTGRRLAVVRPQPAHRPLLLRRAPTMQCRA